MTTENIGEIVIAPRVLEVITGIAATKVDGVYALQNKNVTDGLSKTSLGRGVYLQTEEDGTVNVDIYVSLQYGVNVPAVSIEIQKAINGDYVVRLHDAIISCSDVTGHAELYVTGIEEDLSSCKDANEIFKGEYNEFLRRYKHKESDTNIYRLTDISYDENGSITGIQRDFIPRLDQVV